MHRGLPCSEKMSKYPHNMTLVDPCRLPGPVPPTRSSLRQRWVLQFMHMQQVLMKVVINKEP
jgi:hypothetical protein